MKKTSTSLVVLGILILLNLIVYKYYFRIDLTSDKQYTLGKATKNILKNLDDPVTVRAYFSKNLPPDVAKTKEDFKDLLDEYAGISGGKIEYKFIDPSKDDETEKEALQNGLNPVMINLREKDEIKQQKAFLGATISYNDRKEVIPFIKPGTAMEYMLTTAIKKVSIENKPKVAIISGNGEPSLSDLSQVNQTLSILYTPEVVDLNTQNEISKDYKVAMIIAPTDSFSMQSLQKLDSYLANGGNLVMALNMVDGNFQTAMGEHINTGLENWLKNKGLEIEQKFVLDQDCGAITVSQNQGFFTMQNQIKFPFLPIIRNFKDHLITKGIEEVVLKFASPMHFNNKNDVTFTELATSSAHSATLPATTYFDVMKRWSQADFPESNITVAGILEGKLAGENNSKIVVFSDGDFAVTGSGRQRQNQSQNNVSLLVNAVDWLGDDTGLISLRTKGTVSRPIKQEYLTEEASSKRNFIKYLNFGLPILLMLIIGLVNMQRKKAIRTKRMLEDFSK